MTAGCWIGFGGDAGGGLLAEPDVAAEAGQVLVAGLGLELLQILAGWLAADPTRLSPSLLAYIGHPAYGLDTLRADVDRFTFLLGGSDGEDHFGPHQP